MSLKAVELSSSSGDAHSHATNSTNEDDVDELILGVEGEASIGDSQESDHEYIEGGSSSTATSKRQKKAVKVRREILKTSHKPAAQVSLENTTKNNPESKEIEKERIGLEIVANGPPKERIIHVAILPLVARHDELPDCFYKNGSIKDPWKWVLKDEITEAKKQKKEKKKTQKEAQGGGGQLNGVSITVVSEEDREDKGQKSNTSKDAKPRGRTPVITTRSNLPKQFSQSSTVPFSQSRPTAFVLESVMPSELLQKVQATALKAPKPSPITPVRLDTPTPAYHNSQAPSKISKHMSSDVFELGDLSSPQELVRVKGAGNIECSMKGCKLNFFAGDRLDHYGIRIEDIHEALRKFGCWFCPHCQVKVQATQISNDEKRLLPLPPRLKLSTQFGDGYLDDTDILSPLLDLTALVQNYTANACTEPSRLFPRVSVVDIPCVRNEFHNTSEKLIILLRKLIKIPAGVSIGQAARQLRLEDDHGFWVNSVLVVMIIDFVFRNGSPFEDSAMWKQGFKYLDFPVATIASMIQDNRIRIMKARPAEFAARLQARHDRFVEDLNATMLPLVGFSSILDETHKAIATAAQELNLLTWAYKSKYSPIWPMLGDKFDAREHTTNDIASENYDGRTILLTKMFGLRCEIPGPTNWRICRMAEVDLLPETKRAISQAPVISQKRKYEMVA